MDEFNILTSLPEIKCEYEVDVLNDDGEEEIENREISFNINYLDNIEIDSESQGERAMGIEILHTIEGTLDNEGDIVKVIIEAWEYPEGAYNNHSIIEASIEK
ncbi:MAG: hypothetical protein ACRC4S_06990 [Cetobacterium sp.]